jgi:exopolysaccharide biosynthesis polyprenyl glycosylphosphotransferase
MRNVLFMGVYLAYWHMVLRSFGLYRSHRLTPTLQEWRTLIGAVLVGVAPLIVFRHLLRLQVATLPFLTSYVAATFIGLGVERQLLRGVAHFMRMRGRNLRNVIVVGSDRDAVDMATRLQRRPNLGYQVVDLVEIDRVAAGLNGYGDAAVLKHITDVIARHPIDEVFVVLRLTAAQPLIQAIVALCEEQGITVRLLSSLVDLVLAKAQIDELDGRPVITIFTGPPDSVDLLIKRVIDVVVSFVGLVLLAPLFAAIGIAVRLDSPGPVLFAQERVGLNRRRFRALKFRTMVQDAEQRQAALEPLNEADGPVFKIKNDPRITRIGRWLRQLSLDELPQLWNVLSGDMSLVGPRPLPIRDVDRIDVSAHKRRFSVKPGITCLWQINGRVQEFEYWIKSDMEYIDNWSLALDFMILMKTIPAVLSRRGAY